MAYECENHFKALDNCEGDKPYFCVHANGMCYGLGEYCSAEEFRLRKCLPDDDITALNWCQHNLNNFTALPHPQCKGACWDRFNATQLNSFSCPVKQDDFNWWIVAFTVQFILIAILALMVGKLCFCKKKRLRHAYKMVDTEGTHDPDDISHKRAEQQLNQQDDDGADAISSGQLSMRGTANDRLLEPRNNYSLLEENFQQRDGVIGAISSNESLPERSYPERSIMTTDSAPSSEVSTPGSDGGYVSRGPLGQLSDNSLTTGLDIDLSNSTPCPGNANSSSATQAEVRNMTAIPSQFPETEEVRSSRDMCITNKTLYSVPIDNGYLAT